MAALNDREAEVYDRQIRLWGAEAQKRMKDSVVLVVGCNAINAELTKNIVLSGINVALCDSGVVTAQDLGANFFLTADDIGKQVWVRRNATHYALLPANTPAVSLPARSVAHVGTSRIIVSVSLGSVSVRL